MNQFYVSPNICSFFQPGVEFLGLLAGRNGIPVDPRKVDVINSWPRSKKLTIPRGFLGIVQYFNGIIKSFEELARSLKDLTRKQLE